MHVALQEAQHSGPASSLAVCVAKILLCLARYRHWASQGEDEADESGVVSSNSRFWYYHGPLLDSGALQASAMVGGCCVRPQLPLDAARGVVQGNCAQQHAGDYRG